MCSRGRCERLCADQIAAPAHVADISGGVRLWLDLVTQATHRNVNQLRVAHTGRILPHIFQQLLGGHGLPLMQHEVVQQAMLDSGQFDESAADVYFAARRRQA